MRQDALEVAEVQLPFADRFLELFARHVAAKEPLLLGVGPLTGEPIGLGGGLDVPLLVADLADWQPLVDRMKSLNKQIVGMAVQPAGVADRFDRFLNLHELVEMPVAEPEETPIAPSKAPVFTLLVATIESLEKGSQGVIWGSHLKREMHRRDPEFDEASLGYTTFSDLLEDADRYQIIQLERDDRSGNYYVAGLASE